MVRKENHFNRLTQRRRDAENPVSRCLADQVHPAIRTLTLPLCLRERELRDSVLPPFSSSFLLCPSAPLLLCHSCSLYRLDRHAFFDFTYVSFDHFAVSDFFFDFGDFQRSRLGYLDVEDFARVLIDQFFG